MTIPTLWVWNGSPDDRLDVLRYVRATDRDLLMQPLVQDLLVAERNKVRSLDGGERLHTAIQELRKLLDVFRSECRNELVRGKIDGLAPDGPHACLWTNLRDRAIALLDVTKDLE